MPTTPDNGADQELVTVSRWRVATPERQQATLDALATTWAAAPWPENLITYDVHTGTDGTSLLHHSRWKSRTAFEQFQQQGRDERVGQVFQAVPGIERADLRLYHLDRARTFDTRAQPGAVVIVTFDTDCPEWQSRLVDVVLDYQDRIGLDPARAPGMISNRFHASTDGTRVINYAEFTDEDAHQRLVDSTLGAHDELPTMIGQLEGVRARGFERFLPGLRLRPRFEPVTDASR
jgi:hypothetical protein